MDLCIRKIMRQKPKNTYPTFESFLERFGLKCFECGGSGKIYIPTGIPYESDHKKCEICNGTGKGSLEKAKFNYNMDQDRYNNSVQEYARELRNYQSLVLKVGKDEFKRAVWFDKGT